MKFATGFIVSILTASVYGLATAPNARKCADIEGRTGPAQAYRDPHHAVPLLRAYSPGQIHHFYTTNAAEFQNAVTNPGYSDECTTGYVSAQTCGDPRHAIPLLRAYSAGESDHFYTTNAAELQNAVTNLGYSNEGTTGYVFSDQEPHSIPLYRLYNAKDVDHFYTTNAAERDNAVANLGYNNEGIAGYVYPDTVCGALPLYRLYSSAGTDHFYTMSPAERDNASNNFGYTQEGIAGYTFPF